MSLTMLAMLLFWAAITLVGLHALLGFRLLSAMLCRRPPLPPDSACPRAVVILCLRGPDPFLRDTLLALFAQDYPAYDIHLLLDHAGDPARSIAEEIIRETGARNVAIDTVREPRATCSLKCSALIQGVSRILDTHEAVVLIDADVVPHRTWLREIVAPLAQEGVGAATGNRWYMPSRPSCGSLARYVWNVPAMPQMVAYGIPWGGSLALRSAVVRQAKLLDLWAHSLSDDALVYDALRKHSWRVAFVPSLIMVNRELIRLDDLKRWLRRQLLMARLYHPRWAFVLAHALVVTLVPAALLGALLAASIAENWTAVVWTGTGLGAHLAGSLLLIGLAERMVRGWVCSRGESTAWLTPRVLATAPAALFLAQMVYAIAVFGSLTLRIVEWRQVCYRVDGPWEIQLLEYQPYRHHRAGNKLASL